VAESLPTNEPVTAAEIYGRLAQFKDATPTPSLEDVLAALTAPAETPQP
jgi:hypothetical protein